MSNNKENNKEESPNDRVQRPPLNFLALHCICQCKQTRSHGKLTAPTCTYEAIISYLPHYLSGENIVLDRNENGHVMIETADEKNLDFYYK